MFTRFKNYLEVSGKNYKNLVNLILTLVLGLIDQEGIGNTILVNQKEVKVEKAEDN
jgi:hypothetical protein